MKLGKPHLCGVDVVEHRLLLEILMGQPERVDVNGRPCSDSEFVHTIRHHALG